MCTEVSIKGSAISHSKASPTRPLRRNFAVVLGRSLVNVPVYGLWSHYRKHLRNILLCVEADAASCYVIKLTN